MADPLQKKHETTIRDFLNVVFRWKYIVLSVFLLTTFFIVFLRASKPVTYVASSRVLVERGRRSNVFIANPQTLAWAEEMSSQLEVILSEVVFSDARRIFADSLTARGLQGTRTFQAGAVRADVVGESNVISIIYSGTDPVACEIGCDAVTEAYVSYYREATALPLVDDFFDSEIDNALSELAEWRRRKNDFLNREKYIGVKEQGTRLMWQLSQLEARIAEVTADLSAQEVRVQNLKGLFALSDEELDQRLSATATDSPVQTRSLADIRSELQKLRAKSEELHTLYTEKHPEVIAVGNQISRLMAQVRQEIQNAYDRAVAEYDELTAKHQTLVREANRAQAGIAVLPDKDKELAAIEDEIRAYEEKYQLLLQKRQEAEINVATSADFDVTVLTPPGKAWPRRTSDYVRMAVGPFLSLIVGLGLAFFFESMDHSLKNAAEVEEYLKASVLATMTETRSKD